ncbi:hypothetical protein FJ693_17330, partial [Georgenia yuyongxinii]
MKRWGLVLVGACGALALVALASLGVGALAGPRDDVVLQTEIVRDAGPTPTPPPPAPPAPAAAPT